MFRTSRFVLTLAAAAVLSAPAFSAPSRSTESGGSHRFGLGLSSYGGGGAVANTTGAMSALIEFNQIHSIQILFGIGSTTPAFNFGTGAAYRARICHHDWVGFHLGGMINVGIDAGASFLKFNGIGGVNIRIIDSLVLYFEAGPSLNVLGGVSFSMAPNMLMGGTAHFMF